MAQRLLESAKSLPILQQEAALLQVVQWNGQSEEDLKTREVAYGLLSKLYCNKNEPHKIQEIILTHDFNVFNKTRAAKIIRQMIDAVAEIPNTTQLQIEMCEALIDWCVKGKKTYLKNKIQIRLATLLHSQGKFSKGLEIIDSIITEVRKADDKHLLLEIYLIESKLNFGLYNIAKAKASLTAARACANQIYCAPVVQADIDLQAGTLYAEERDYRTAYSYFYESFEAFNALEDPRAINSLKYMILCKIMSNNQDDVNQLLVGKYGMKYAGRDLEAMKAINQSYLNKQLSLFTQILRQFNAEIEGDPIIKLHIRQLYDQLLEKNLFQVIQPYRRVQIDYITSRMQMDLLVVQNKLSELILDKKIDGTIDQGNDCLILFDTVKNDNLYKNAIGLFDNMDGVLDRLFQRAKSTK